MQYPDLELQLINSESKFHETETKSERTSAGPQSTGTATCRQSDTAELACRKMVTPAGKMGRAMADASLVHANAHCRTDTMNGGAAGNIEEERDLGVQGSLKVTEH